MSEKRRGLGRGLGSLIPTQPPVTVSPPADDRSGETESAPPGRGADSGAGAAPGSASGSAPGAAAGPATGNGAGGRARSDVADEGGSTVAGGAVGNAYFAEIPVDAITPNPRQPRQVFDEEAMAELVHSVKEIGLLQPVVVRPLEEDGRYELIMGERRWRATREAGLDAVPAIVRQTGDDEMLRDALLENLHRSELNPLEEAAAYQQLLEDFGCTHEELSSRIGRSRPQISNTLRLLRLSPAVQRRVAAGVLSAGHARALLGIEDADSQDRLAARVVAEGISVRGLEEIVAVGGDGSGDASRDVRSKASRPSAPGLADLNERLSDRLDTRVKVSLGKSKGKIAIEFASLSDLERIVNIIDPRNRNDRPI